MTKVIWWGQTSPAHPFNLVYLPFPASYVASQVLTPREVQPSLFRAHVLSSTVEYYRHSVQRKYFRNNGFQSTARTLSHRFQNSIRHFVSKCFGGNETFQGKAFTMKDCGGQLENEVTHANLMRSFSELGCVTNGNSCSATWRCC